MILTGHDIFSGTRALLLRAAACAFAGALALGTGAASAQTLGIATMQPGTLSYTVGSAVSSVMKEAGGVNMLVQPAAGESALIPLVSRGEADFGVANIFELEAAMDANPELRLVGTLHPLRGGLFVRKDSAMQTIADLKGKNVVMGFSAMRAIDPMTRAILAAGGLGPDDINPVMVANIVRGADDFTSGAADTFIFAFGAPKLREVDATAGGIRALTIPAEGLAAAQAIQPDGYLTRIEPGPIFVGVDAPMDVYTWDNMLFTNASVPDETIMKLIETLEANKDALVAVQPALREFGADALYKAYNVPYHPGALKYFDAHGITPKAIR